LLGGRCYDCASRIPAKHPLIEAVFALAFVFIGLALFRKLGIYK
jgi:prepilin signal peptidase PulO-like enzyme (type II secretory pathway)